MPASKPEMQTQLGYGNGQPSTAATAADRRAQLIAEQDEAAVRMLRRYLTQVRRDKVTGQLMVEINLNDGGITSKYVYVKAKEAE